MIEDLEILVKMATNEVVPVDKSLNAVMQIADIGLLEKDENLIEEKLNAYTRIAVESQGKEEVAYFALNAMVRLHSKEHPEKVQKYVWDVYLNSKLDSIRENAHKLHHQILADLVYLQNPKIPAAY